MTDLPTVRPEKPAEPLPAGTREPLSAIDVLSFLSALFAVGTLAFWGFTAWDAPWNIVVGIAAPLGALVLWGLVVSPRAVLRVHPFIRGLVELLIALSATIAWWSAGQAWIGLGYGVVAVIIGVIAGRKRLS
ncbi:membrane protein YdbS with pleckstrin-like domain [Microbacterium marinum]|uniref:Membrane protein YdbS with pleckstrin-like domain n=1 Tax=Microbacterium marinum TaxID=421115 RepID=A0A7W7BRA5_9MICO|nr:YrdB family protein [Microbacterium marinum]MBB4666259.1 membrane protein YdbS with pleckstrin-like domain [Microbacterium marinum]